MAQAVARNRAFGRGTLRTYVEAATSSQWLVAKASVLVAVVAVRRPVSRTADAVRALIINLECEIAEPIVRGARRLDCGHPDALVASSWAEPDLLLRVVPGRPGTQQDRPGACRPSTGYGLGSPRRPGGGGATWSSLRYARFPSASPRLQLRRARHLIMRASARPYSSTSVKCCTSLRSDAVQSGGSMSSRVSNTLRTLAGRVPDITSAF